MLEMLRERKAALEAQGKKGFTLMEMLIVIAIIAILIAIAIPVFTGQMNAAKDAADEANGRALYAAISADYIMSGKDSIATKLSGNDSAKITYDGTVYTFNQKAKVSDDYRSVDVTLTNNSVVKIPASAS